MTPQTNKAADTGIPEIRRTFRDSTPEEHQHWLELKKLVESDLPDLKRQAKEALAEARAAAMQEPTISGQLRRAIADSGYDHRQLGEFTGIAPGEIARFLSGTASLDSASIDKIAAALHQELRPVG